MEHSSNQYKQYAYTGYVLLLLGVISPVSPVILLLLAGLLAYLQRSKAIDTIYYSHFDWQFMTFWVSFLCLALLFPLKMYAEPLWVIGVLPVAGWLFYRVYTGVIELWGNQAIAKVKISK